MLSECDSRRSAVGCVREGALIETPIGKQMGAHVGEHIGTHVGTHFDTLTLDGKSLEGREEMKQLKGELMRIKQLLANTQADLTDARLRLKTLAQRSPSAQLQGVAAGVVLQAKATLVMYDACPVTCHVIESFSGIPTRPAGAPAEIAQSDVADILPPSISAAISSASVVKMCTMPPQPPAQPLLGEQNILGVSPLCITADVCLQSVRSCVHVQPVVCACTAVTFVWNVCRCSDCRPRRPGLAAYQWPWQQVLSVLTSGSMRLTRSAVGKLTAFSVAPFLSCLSFYCFCWPSLHCPLPWRSGSKYGMFHSCSPSIPFRPLLLSLYIYRCYHKFVSAETTNAKALQWKVYIENDSTLSNIMMMIAFITFKSSLVPLLEGL